MNEALQLVECRIENLARAMRHLVEAGLVDDERWRVSDPVGHDSKDDAKLLRKFVDRSDQIRFGRKRSLALLVHDKLQPADEAAARRCSDQGMGRQIVEVLQEGALDGFDPRDDVYLLVDLEGLERDGRGDRMSRI